MESNRPSPLTPSKRKKRNGEKRRETERNEIYNYTHYQHTRKRRGLL